MEQKKYELTKETMCFDGVTHQSYYVFSNKST